MALDNGRAGMAAIREMTPDVALMDRRLGDLDGLEMIREAREASPNTRFVMVSACSDTRDIVTAVRRGFCDYVTKPFRFGVLLARIRAQLRSHEQSEDAVFTIGPYSFRPSAKVLIDPQEKKVRLTEKETNILKYLYRAGAKVVGREVLLTEVWGYNSGVTTHTLETHIYRLRQKIEKDPAKAQILVTDAGGYRLVP